MRGGIPKGSQNDGRLDLAIVVVSESNGRVVLRNLTRGALWGGGGGGSQKQPSSENIILHTRYSRRTELYLMSRSCSDEYEHLGNVGRICLFIYSKHTIVCQYQALETIVDNKRQIIDQPEYSEINVKKF